MLWNSVSQQRPRSAALTVGSKSPLSRIHRGAVRGNRIMAVDAQAVG